MVPPLVPPVTVNATVDPPVVNALPAASRAVSVSVAVPPAPIVSLDTVTTDVAAEITPGVTVTVGGVEATGAELIVAPTVVAVPARTPVNVAVYVPLPLSVAGDGEIVPVLDPPATLKTTVAPPAVMLLPPASFPWSVSVTVLPDCTLPFDTVMMESAGEIAPEVALAPTFNAATVGNAGSVTWNVWAPGAEPSTAGTLACPRLSAVTVVSVGAPPVGPRKRTTAPATGKLSAARTSTWSGTT